MKFSWHTIIHPDWGNCAPIEFADDARERFPDSPGMYLHDEGLLCLFQACEKPNRKGGHTHNHKKNALLRTKFRSKDERFRVKY